MQGAHTSSHSCEHVLPRVRGVPRLTVSTVRESAGIACVASCWLAKVVLKSFRYSDHLLETVITRTLWYLAPKLKRYAISRCDKGPCGLQDVPSIIKNCKAPGPLYLSALSEGELRHLNNMMGRLYQLAEAATAVRCLG